MVGKRVEFSILDTVISVKDHYFKSKINTHSELSKKSVYSFSTKDYKMSIVENGKVPFKIIENETLYDTVIIPSEGVCYIVEEINNISGSLYYTYSIYISKP